MKSLRFGLFFAALIVMLALIACAPAAVPPAAPAQPTAAPAEPTAVPAAPTAAPAEPTAAPAAPTAMPAEPTAAATNTPAPTPTPPPPGVTAAPGALNIEFWHALTGASQVAEFQKLADEFNAANPQYFVMPILQGNYAATLQKMNASITANSLPDLVLGNPGDLGTYHAAGVMRPLDDLMADSTNGLGELASQIDPALYFDKFGDETIGVSTGRSIQVMYYNADLLKAAGFDSPPATFEEFEEVCAAVSKPPDVYCYAMVPSASTFANLVWNNGGDYASADETMAAFDNPAGVATLEWLKKLADNEWAYIPAAAFGDQTDFGNGKVAFTVGSTAGLPFYQRAVAGSAAPFEWGIAPLPRGADGGNYVDIFGPSIGILQSTPEKELGSWLFLKYLLSQPVEEEWAQVTTYFPANKAAADAVGAMDPAQIANAGFAAVLPQYKQAVTFVADGKREPTAAAWQSVRNIIANMMTAVFTTKSGADFTATDPAAAAKEGVERVNKALSEFGQ
ncbi:MAG: ABC transporter substrate-binding protein [Anaerolineae bacterium]|nr:ABC transporter substrate-binding protein [Anaerolineae bacterium]